jgi:hypothetical protein
MKAAPHVRPDGTVTRPVPQNMDEVWARVLEPTIPPYAQKAWLAFRANFKLPQRRRDMREDLGITEDRS